MDIDNFKSKFTLYKMLKCVDDTAYTVIANNNIMDIWGITKSKKDANLLMEFYKVERGVDGLSVCKQSGLHAIKNEIAKQLLNNINESTLDLLALA